MAREDRRVADYFLQTGHFEFGPHFRVPNFGNEARQKDILQCWQQGRELEGWAHIWCAYYEHVLHLRTSLSNNILIQRHESLCNQPIPNIERLLQHCDILVDPEYIKQISRHIKAYRPSPLSTEQKSVVQDITGEIVTQFDY